MKYKLPEYGIWSGIKARCQNPKAKLYYKYGGRGITVCARWQIFENFLEDMGNRPTPYHIINRKDTDKGYYKENCRWATRSEQTHNQKLSSTNRSGIRGVHFIKRENNWVAFVHKGHHRETLYHGKDFFEACCARKSWEARNLL